MTSPAELIFQSFLIMDYLKYLLLDRICSHLFFPMERKFFLSTHKTQNVIETLLVKLAIWRNNMDDHFFKNF